MSNAACTMHRDAFLAQMRQWTVTASCGRDYVIQTPLIQWMNHGDPKNVEALLAECWQGGHNLDLSDPSVQKLSFGQDRCLLLFSILLELGKGHLIFDLQTCNVSDHSLPLNMDEIRNLVRAISPPEHEEDLAEKIFNGQWKYYPLRFCLNDTNKTVSAEQIVPFVERHLIKDGGTAFVHKVLVQAEFVDDALQKASASSLSHHTVYGWVSARMKMRPPLLRQLNANLDISVFHFCS